MNRNAVSGLFLVAIALTFGGQALQYSIGNLSDSGPGLFPVMVSSVLLVTGLTTVVRAFLTERAELSLQAKNIAIVIVSLGGFALISEFVNMIAGIAFLVFFSALAGPSYSVARNLKITAALLLIAFMLKKLLGLNLPLY